MRCIKRNRQPFYYAQYLGNEEVIDEEGYLTGIYKASYTKPVKMYANISPAVGNAQIEQFGRSLNYSKTIVTDDMNCPINEYSVLWIDTDPKFDDEGNATVDFNYTVSSIAKLFWSITYAIRRVEINSEKTI